MPKRYDLRIPPGYKDPEEKDGQAKYGDAILWFQIIDYAKEKKLPIIFVTRDDKVDWWNTESESKNDKQPDYELIKEFTSKTGFAFYIYTTDRFLYWAKKQIGAKISDESIKEIKQTTHVTTYVPSFSRGFTYSPAFSLWPTEVGFPKLNTDETDWENFIFAMSSFDRKQLVDLLDEVTVKGITISSYLEPRTFYTGATGYGSVGTFGTRISEEVNGDYRIEYKFSSIIVRKENLRAFRDYVASRMYYSV